MLRQRAAGPYLAGALVIHAAVLAVLAAWPIPDPIMQLAHARAAAAEARTSKLLAATQSRALMQRVEHMEAIWRALSEAARGAPGERPAEPGGSAGDGSEAALAARAQALGAAIDAEQRRLRAAALARLARISPSEALRRVDALDAPPLPVRELTPAALIAQLERRADDALEAQREQVAARQEGVRVRYPADGIPRSLKSQLAEMIRNGPPQGRVGEPGFEGGHSVNPKWVEGVEGGRIGRPEDTAPAGTRMDFRAPVNEQGGRIDLTGTGGRGLDPLPRPHELPPGSVHTGAGRVLGPGGALADRVYLDAWYLLGPFQAAGSGAMRTRLPPEEGVDLDATYRSTDGRLLSWRYASRGFYPFVLAGAEPRSVYYAYTELRLDEARDVWLSVAADDDSMLWLDGRLVWVSPPGDKPWYRPPYYLPHEEVASLALSEGQRRVHLERGAHRLLLKLFNDRDQAFFSVVLSP